MKIKTLLNQMQQQLQPLSASPCLDAQLLLMKVLHVSRAHLYAYDDQVVTGEQQQQIEVLLQQRCAGMPMAYLLGAQEFYSLDLKVNSHVLIPRPETECLLDWVLDQTWPDTMRAIDLGTGSGAIAIALAKAKPQWQLIATDQSEQALAVARHNAEQHQLRNLAFFKSDWFHSIEAQPFNLVISNPPYIQANDAHLRDLQFEPQSALVAADEGMADLVKIIKQATSYLVDGGWIVVEHGYDQADRVCQCAEKAGYQAVVSNPDLSGVPRFVVAKWCL